MLLEHAQGKTHGFSPAAGAKILLIALFLRSQDLVSRIRGGDRREGGTGRVKYPDGLSRMTNEIQDVGEGVSFAELGSNLTKGVYPIWHSQRDVQVV